jgi:hypothetical protein
VNRCSVPASTLHSSGFARLASGAFYFAIPFFTFHEIITFTYFSIFYLGPCEAQEIHRSSQSFSVSTIRNPICQEETVALS